MSYCEKVDKMKIAKIKKISQYEMYGQSKSKYLHSKTLVEDVGCILYDYL